MLYDVYVLTDKRNKKFIQEFLDTFIDDSWYPVASEYEIPRFSPIREHVFTDIEPLIQYGCVHDRMEHAIYWKNRNSNNLSTTMLFFTEDAHLILGFSVQKKEFAQEHLDKLLHFSDSPFGYIDFESPPEMTAELFKQLNSIR